jgi:hypothetical protein
MIEETLWSIVEKDPKENLRQYAIEVSNKHPNLNTVSRDDIRNIFVKWGWSWKIPGKIHFDFILHSFISFHNLFIYEIICSINKIIYSII